MVNKQEIIKTVEHMEIELKEIKKYLNGNKQKDETSEKLKNVLKKYSCYSEVINDQDFLNSILKLLKDNNLKINDIEATLENIKYASDKGNIRDIKTYTYKSIHKKIEKKKS